jgi:hypothetical protein
MEPGKKEQDYPVTVVNCPHPKGSWSVIPKTEKEWEEEGTLSMTCQDCGKVFEAQIKWGEAAGGRSGYRRAGFEVIGCNINPK